MTPDECMDLILGFRISVDAATRIVQTERGDVDVPIWIARRQGAAVSCESLVGAIEALALRQGLWRRHDDTPRSSRLDCPACGGEAWGPCPSCGSGGPA